MTLRRAAALGPQAGHHRPSIEELRRYVQQVEADPTIEGKFARMRLEKLTSQRPGWNRLRKV